MKQVVSILATWLILTVGTVYAADYDHSFKFKDMDIQWRLDGDQIHFQLSAKTTGWVGIGFDPEDAMKGADIIIGAVKKGKVRIEDHYGNRKRNHASDEKLGGESNILNPKGSEENGVTTISFTLPLERKGEYDKSIDPSKVSRVMVAYGTGRDSFKGAHKSRGVYDINYTTGETKKIK